MAVKRRRLMVLLLVIALAAAVGLSVYSWQQHTVHDQAARIDTLNAKVADLKQEISVLKDEQSNPADSIPVYSDIQKKARNSKRQSDIIAVMTQLEVFYADNGYYPSRANMNDAAWRNAHMKSLDSTALADPLMNGTPTALAAAPAAKIYAYAPTNAGGASCEQDDTSCAKYTLTATFEGTVNGAATYVKNNLE
jgi:cell division protein FtsB